MMRRRATILLHWSCFGLLIALLAVGPLAPLLVVFAILSLSMAGLWFAFGLMNDPGPKLTGLLRRVHPMQSHAMYAAMAIVGFVGLLQLSGFAPQVDLPAMHFVLFALGMLHGVFHMWRHTALGDGALRRMTPRALHKLL